MDQSAHFTRTELACSMELTIEQVTELSVANLDYLVTESLRDGFHLVERLCRQWRSGTNRFDRQGEAFFLSRNNGRVMGCCGLNVDPFADDSTIGRVRRLYVSQEFRRRGVATALLKRVCGEAQKSFRVLRASVGTLNADVFYESVGFTPVHGFKHYTHVLELLKNAPCILDTNKII